MNRVRRVSPTFPGKSGFRCKICYSDSNQLQKLWSSLLMLISLISKEYYFLLSELIIINHVSLAFTLTQHGHSVPKKTVEYLARLDHI